MLAQKIKVICFFLILILHPLNAPAVMISAHTVRFWGLTYLAIQSVNFANPVEPLWALYDSGLPMQLAIQNPYFFLSNAVLDTSAVIQNLLTGTTTIGSLAGTIMAPYWYQLYAQMNPGTSVISPQQLTFEVLSSAYFPGVTTPSGLPVIQE